MTDRREQIITAARELLTESGPSAVSVRACAGRAGIGASTLRHYFPTQNALLEAVFASMFDGNLSDLRITDVSIDPHERLRECVTQFIPATDDLDQTLAQWFEVVTAVASPQASPERRAAWSAFTGQAHVRVLRWLEILAEEGAVRPGDRIRQARLLLAVIDGVALGLLLPDTIMGVTEVRETLDDAIDAVLL